MTNPPGSDGLRAQQGTRECFDEILRQMVTINDEARTALAEIRRARAADADSVRYAPIENQASASGPGEQSRLGDVSEQDFDLWQPGG